MHVRQGPTRGKQPKNRCETGNRQGAVEEDVEQPANRLQNGGEVCKGETGLHAPRAHAQGRAKGGGTTIKL